MMAPSDQATHSTSPSKTPVVNFVRPPVVEVALSIQFNPIVGLTTPRVGLLWARFRDRFPHTEEHAPLPSVKEEFGASRAFRVGLEIHAVDAPPLPRCWFLNEAHTELIQVQQDRFIHSWRKQATGDEYPHYEQIRETFRQEVDLFARFLKDEQLGELVPNQCEITYVDEIPLDEGWDHFGHLDRVLTVWAGRHSGSFLPAPEDVALRVRYIIPDASGEPIGRLHVTAGPANRRADRRPILLVNVTARGRPEGEGIGGALRFLDIGHEWAVQGFVSLTTPELHTLWGRQG